jgi:TolB-like protein
MRPLIYALLSSACLVLSGCETVQRAQAIPEPTYEQAQNSAFNTANYNAVGELMKRYQAPASASNTSGGGSGAPFIVATLVNIDQLEQSSTLGRVISEQVGSRMTQLGFSVIELKVRNGVYMKRSEGELMLTREIKEVATNHRAQAVIVGTYAESSTLIYINLKLVNPANSMVIAAYDYALPLDKQIRSMLRKQ